MQPTAQQLPAGASDYKPGDPRSDLMNPETRDRILTALAALSREFPTVRFGQLVCNVTMMAAVGVTDNVYDIEDNDLLEAAENWLAQRRADQ